MSNALSGVDEKLKRARSHIDQLDQQLSAYRKSNPYSVRVHPDVDAATGQPVGRLIAVRNLGVPDPDPSTALLAGEAVYQMRSALDHLIHQLVIIAGNEGKLIGSRRHQFPIFENRKGYVKRAPGMIDGVDPVGSTIVSAAIESHQPYARSPNTATFDPLWLLQDINNTDKHRLIPIHIVGIGEVRGHDARGVLFSLSSPDIVPRL